MKPVKITGVESALDIIAAAPPHLREQAGDMVADAFWRANRESDEEILAVLRAQDERRRAALDGDAPAAA